MRLLRLGLAASAALVLFACSPPASKCSAATCSGCCDAMGACQVGSSGLACGIAGGACDACELGEVCTLGQCTMTITGSGGGGGSTGGGGGGASTGGGSATGGGASTGGGSATGGGGATGGGSATGGGGGGSQCAGTLRFCTDRCLDLQADPENCGRCGNVCGQGQVCNRGTCAVLPDDCTMQSNGCGSGYYCDPVSKRCMTGCRLTTDCPMGAACTAGTCACPTGQHACGQQCVSDDSATSCGSRCSACPQPAHATALCASSACAFTCNTGYRLESGQCIDVDECATNNGGCSANATCTNTDGDRTCACASGFTGDGVTCTDVNECATNNGGCDVNATCTNTPGSRTCACGTGWVGNGMSCTDVDECVTNNGGCASTLNGGVCTNTPGSRTCACANGFTGNGFSCTDVNECATNNGGCAAVANGGVCTNSPGSRTCSCASGFTGNGMTCTDVDECLTNNGGCAAVANGGVCTNSVGSRACSCASGFTGNGFTCTDTNECATNNGGCASVANGGVCTNTPGSRSCACANGFTGDGFTCMDVNECSTNNGGCAAVANGGVCTNTTGSRTCACASGYTGNGFTCMDVNECLTSNGGCAAVANGGVCTNTGGSRTCGCASGYTGDGFACMDVNECLTNNGGCAAVANGGVCTNTGGSRTCACASGYTGDGFTCMDVNECSTNNGGCSANATCGNIPGSRTCTCNPGFAGNGITCTPNGDTCAAPVVLTLGTPFTSSTAGATNDISTALSTICTADALAGPDTVHVFTPASTGTYRVTTTGFAGLDVWLGPTCGATASCVARKPESSSVSAFNFRGTAGVPAYIVVDAPSASGSYTMTVTTAPSLPNETCSSPTTLTAGTPLSGSFVDAINDLVPQVACGTPSYTQPELVYVFTPTATGNYSLRETTTSDVVMWLSATCDGTCTSFTDEPETLLMPLTAGTPYYVFIEPYTTATTFTLAIDQVLPPTNDTCSTPTTLPLSMSLNGTTVGANNDSGGPLSVACSSVTVPGRDVVYSFTPPSTGSYALNVTSPNNTAAWVSTVCGDAATCSAIEPSFGSANTVFRGTAGTPVFITIDTQTTSTVDFGVSVDPVTAPANDTCATAQALTLATPTAGTTIGAADDLNPVVACGTSERHGEVMYTFTPPSTGNYLFRETTASDVVMWLATACDGTCSNLVDEPEELLVTLTGGTTYYLVVEPYSARAAFSLEVVTAAPPTNDTCSGAQALALATPINATTSLATDDYTGALSGACGASSVPGRDVVYSFTPASSGNFSILTAGSGGFSPTVWVSPTCGTLASCVSASSGQQVVRGTAATPLFVTVDSSSSTSSGSFTLTVNSIAAPANDTCATATPLTLNVSANGTTVGAVNDVHPQPSCANSTRRNGEVMFSFTPSSSGQYVFRETSSSDVLMWVSAACDGTCLGYVDDPEVLTVNLVAGTTYFLFVEPYSTPNTVTVLVGTN